MAYEATTSNNLRPKTMWSDVDYVQTYEPLSKTGGAMLDLDTIRKIFGILDAYGIPAVLLQGGEYFLRSDALDILREARKRFFTSVVTNATVLNDEICDFLHSENVMTAVYVPAVQEEVFESVNQVKGSYRMFVTGVKKLLDRGIKPIFLIPVSKPLIPVLGRTVRNIAEMGGDMIKFTVYPGSGYGRQFRNELMLSPADVVAAQFKIEELKEKYGKEVAMYHGFAAPYLANQCTNFFALDVEGNIIACPYLRLRYGNIIKDNIDKQRLEMARNLTIPYGCESQTPKECGDCKITSPLTTMPCRGGCRCVTYNLYDSLSGPDLGCPYLFIKTRTNGGSV